MPCRAFGEPPPSPRAKEAGEGLRAASRANPVLDRNEHRDRQTRHPVRALPRHARPPRHRGRARGLRAGLPDACARQRRHVGAPQLQARRRGGLQQPLARQVGLPQGRADHRGAHLQLLRRRPAQHRRRARQHAADHPVRSTQRRAARDRRRALELRDPQRGRGGDRLQMGRAEEPKNPRPGRDRHHGSQCAALPAHALPVRRDPLHLAPAGDAPRLRGQMVDRARHPGGAEGFGRGSGARRRHRGRRHHLGRDREPRSVAQAGLHLHFACAARARSRRLGENGQGRDRQLGVQHAPARVPSHRRKRAVLARATSRRDP